MEGDKGTDPNDEVLRKFGDPSKGEDHKPVNLTEAQNKGYDEPEPFRITNNGNG